MNKDERKILLNSLKEQQQRYHFFDEERQRVKERIERIKLELTKLSFTKFEIEALILQMKVESQNYKNDKLINLSQLVNNYIENIFPLDSFRVKFIPYVYNNKEMIDLYSGRSDESLAPIGMQHGRFYRQYIGFLVTSAIQLESGCRTIIMDEAFNSGDPETVQKLESCIKELLGKNIQIIMIEHQREVYHNIPRLQYVLERDKKENSVNIKEVFEYTR